MKSLFIIENKIVISTPIMRYLQTAIFLMAFLLSNAQDSFSSSELDLFVKDKKNKSYIEKYGYSFISIPKEKNFRDRIAGEIVINDTNRINFSEINVSFLMHDYQYYYVKNLKLLFVLKSIDHLKKDMNNEN